MSLLLFLKGRVKVKLDEKRLILLVSEWQQMTEQVLDLKVIQGERLQALLKQTYGALTDYHKAQTVPKVIAKLLLELEEFLYFAYLMEEKEGASDFYSFRLVYAIIKALKEGFFSGEYECDYPKLQIADDNNLIVLDFENDELF
ncbi:MAG: hypothetical protein U0K54_00030 [Acutalibacteraceae bacterium]|nr:hypothetical protein [Acutalibacteraceae bacterium]